MESVLVAIYDSKAQTYTAPRTEKTIEVARRGFADAVNDPKKESALAIHPEDYTLFRIGTYNHETGVVTHEDKISIANGVDVLLEQ